MGYSHTVEVDGHTYSSKREAAYTLHVERPALSWREIGTLIGTSEAGAEVAARGWRKRLDGSEKPRSAKARRAHRPDATPGQWTPEKRDKVRRLFGTTMIYIADAVQVPPAELLKYVLHGVVPPSQKVEKPDDIDWQPDQAQLPPPSPVAEASMLPREAFEAPDTDPDVVDAEQFIAGSGPGQPLEAEPDRADDEAELENFVETCALCGLPSPEDDCELDEDGEAMHPACRREAAEAEQRDQPGEQNEVAPPAPARFPAPDPRKVAQPVETIAPTRSPATGLFPAGRMVRLVREDGKWLHESLQGFTDKTEFAWEGTRVQFDTVKAQMPRLVAKLQFEVVP